MGSKGISKRWKQWFHLGRLIPVLVVLGSGIVIVLPYVSPNLIQLSHAEQVIIALLGLFAGEALTERLSVLEKVQTDMENLATYVKRLPAANIRLEDRTTFTGSLSELVKEAQNLDMLGLTLKGAMAHSQGCFERMAENPTARLRFLIVEPGSPAVESAVGFRENEDAAYEVESAKRTLAELAGRDNVFVRFTPVAPSFSLLITDPGSSEGKTQVELYARSIGPNERPHFVLTQENQPWYNFFTEQFDRFWEEAQTLNDLETGQ